MLMILVIMGLLVCSVNAWTIEDKENRVSGTVDFYGDGHGILNVTGYPVIDFSWYQSGDIIRANYLFYGIDVYYNAITDELYSPEIANVTLKRD
ncbi:MAG: hypothetical protein WCX79_00225 [Candidatus Paceibacterota bacterium]